MGMFKKIGHRLKSLKKLGTRLAHGASIGLRKTSKVLGRASKMAPEIAGKMAGAGALLTATGLAPAVAVGGALMSGSEVVSKGGALAGKASTVSRTASRGFDKASKGDFDGATLEVKKAKEQHSELFT
jgi:hypothetical protein